MNAIRQIPMYLGMVSLACSAPAKKAIFDLRVIDDNRQPVAGADVMLVFEAYTRKLNHKMNLKTGPDGRLRAVGWSKDEESLDGAISVISKPGYYTTTQEHLGSVNPEDLKDGWEWDVEALLREKAKPIPMYAKEVEMELPEQRKEIGFDFEKADWVKPYGKGEVADCTFIGTKVFEDDDHFETSVVMSFPSENDGMQPDPAQKNEAIQLSKFKTSRTAPLEGYQHTLNLISRWDGERRNKGSTKNINYIFRSRTILDEQGKIKSGHYGKMLNAVDVGKRSGYPNGNPIISFTYYFNPTPNDRNLEFDPHRNLFPSPDGNLEVWQP